MLIRKPNKQAREEKNQTGIKISKYCQVYLSLSQLQETTYAPTWQTPILAGWPYAQHPSRQWASASTYVFVHMEQFKRAELLPTPLSDRKVHMTLLTAPQKPEKAA